MPEKIYMKIKEGDIVRYPVGWTLVVRRVRKDKDGELYVQAEKHREYIYKNIYPWGGALIKEMGFGKANKEEMQYLHTWDI